MTRKVGKSLKLLLVMLLCSTWIVSSVAKADNSPIKKIVANTYIGDAGMMVESFDIMLHDVGKYAEIKASDFEITGNYDGYPLNESLEIAQDNYVDDGIVLTIKEDRIHMEVKAFRYPGGYVSEFAVTSSKFPELSFGKADVSHVATKTVDEFQKESFIGSNGVTLPYRLNLSASPEPRPLVVWLHGGGEVGTDNLKQLTENRGATTWIESGKDTSVLAVQFPENYGWAIYDNEKELAQMKAFFVAHDELIQQLVEGGKVDPDRIYLVGVSSGGGGAFRFMMQYPDLFAGSIVIAAKDTIADYKGTVAPFKKELKELVHMPLWIVHAENDPTTDSRTSTLAYRALTELGSTSVKQTVYDDEFMTGLRLYGGLLHWSWVPAFNDAEMIDWLFSQSKEKAVSSGAKESEDSAAGEGTNQQDQALDSSSASPRGSALELIPDAAVTRAQIAAVLASSLELAEAAETAEFSDVADSWASHSIAQVTQAGMMKGMSEGIFAPEQQVTRAQLAVIADKLIAEAGAELGRDAAVEYHDVPQTHWAYSAVMRIAEFDILTRGMDGSFNPNQAVTGAEVMEVFERLAPLY